MKILYKAHYIGRDIFIIEKDNKFVKVYRSSGLSGTGHSGQILPFSGLNDSINDFRCTPGYIYKEMFYFSRWVHHRKEIYKYPEVEVFMKEIQEFVKDIHPRKHKEVKTVNDILKIAKRINKAMDKTIQDRELLDLRNDIVDYLPSKFKN